MNIEHIHQSKGPAAARRRGPKDKFNLALFERVRRRVEGGEGVVDAIQAEGMGHSQFYHRVGQLPELAEALARARLAPKMQALEDEAFRRAVKGVIKPVMSAGKVVAEVRRYSDTLLMFLLQAYDPETYGYPPGYRKQEGRTKFPLGGRRLPLGIQARNHQPPSRPGQGGASFNTGISGIGILAPRATHLSPKG